MFYVKVKALYSHRNEYFDYLFTNVKCINVRTFSSKKATFLLLDSSRYSLCLTVDQ
jgi:hypothetical protein